MTTTKKILRAGVRRGPMTEPVFSGEVSDPALGFDQSVETPYTDTFGRMIRDLAYDIGELPVVALAMAVDAGRPLRALPVVLAGGGLPHTALVCAERSSIGGPEDLRGKRIATRSYSQTMGVWLRGILQQDYGLSPEDFSWVVTEAAHVGDFADPQHVTLDPGADLFALLDRGEVDAVLASPHVTQEREGLRWVIPDARTAAAEWQARNGLICVNHVLAVQEAPVRSDPALAARLARLFTASRDLAEARRQGGRAFPVYGEAPNRPAIEQLLAHAHAQKLITRPLGYDDLFLPWRPDGAA